MKLSFRLSSSHWKTISSVASLFKKRQFFFHYTCSTVKAGPSVVVKTAFLDILRIIWHIDFMWGSFIFYKQMKQPAKYQYLGIAPLILKEAPTESPSIIPCDYISFSIRISNSILLENWIENNSLKLSRRRHLSTWFKVQSFCVPRPVLCWARFMPLFLNFGPSNSTNLLLFCLSVSSLTCHQPMHFFWRFYEFFRDFTRFYIFHFYF